MANGDGIWLACLYSLLHCKDMSKKAEARFRDFVASLRPKPGRGSQGLGIAQPFLTFLALFRASLSACLTRIHLDPFVTSFGPPSRHTFATGASAASAASAHFIIHYQVSEIRFHFPLELRPSLQPYLYFCSCPFTTPSDISSFLKIERASNLREVPSFCKMHPIGFMLLY